MDDFSKLSYLEDSLPSNSEVSISSTWRSSKTGVVQSSFQTDPMGMKSCSIQVVEQIEQSSQTSDTTNSNPTMLDKEGLVAFLQRVEPLVVSEMKTLSLHTDAFAAAQLQSTSYTARKKDAAIMCYSLHHEAASKAELVATSLSWSSTGQTIAVAFGRYDITGWCTVPGMLATWNIGRQDFNGNKPDVRVEVSSCLMSCSFHPQHPALVAGGTFNGELYVWELGREGDMEIARSDSSASVLHLEPIVAIHWQYSQAEANKHSNKAQAYRIVTLGADGKVLVWLWYKMQAPSFGYELMYAVPGMERRVLWGGCCMAFEHTARTGNVPSFVVGTEGGRVFKCVLDFTELQAKEFQQKAMAGTSDRIELRSPIKAMDFDMHAGPVQGVDCSPFQREFFVTAGRDGLARVCNLLKPQALLTLEPSSASLTAVQWSRTRPLVFAAASGDGRVYFYDLTQQSAGGPGLQCPVLALDISPGTSPVYAVAFNHKEPALVAASGKDGVQVWKLPSRLVEAQQGEANILKKLATAETADEVLGMGDIF